MQRHCRFLRHSVVPVLLSSEADQEFTDSVFPHPKAESRELGFGVEKSKIDVIYTDTKFVVDIVTSSSLPLMLPSALLPMHSVAHEKVSDTTHAIGSAPLPANSVTHEVSDTTYAIGGVSVTSDFDTGFAAASTTALTLYTVSSYVEPLHTVTTTVATTVISPSVTKTIVTTSVVSPVSTVVTSPIVTGTATVTTVSIITSPVVSVDLGAGPSSLISVLYTGQSLYSYTRRLHCLS